MNYTNLTADIDFLCGSTSASYPLADKVRNINNAYQEATRLIWESDANWQFDDSNKTDLPIATTDLVDAQQDYSLPTDAQKIERIEILDKQSNYQKLNQIDWHDIETQSMSELLETAGMPTYYDLAACSIFLYPKPASADVTLTNGLKVYFQRDVTLFTTASTTASPGFATQFHRFLSVAAALDFEKDPQQRAFLFNLRQKMEDGIRNFYSSRNVERKTRINPRNKKYWRQYE